MPKGRRGSHELIREKPVFLYKGGGFFVENIAKFIYNELDKKLNSDMVSISKVKVSETPGAGAFYWEG